jgi:hypothetical protein
LSTRAWEREKIIEGDYWQYWMRKALCGCVAKNLCEIHVGRSIQIEASGLHG